MLISTLNLESDLDSDIIKKVTKRELSMFKDFSWVLGRAIDRL